MIVDGLGNELTQRAGSDLKYAVACILALSFSAHADETTLPPITNHPETIYARAPWIDSPSYYPTLLDYHGFRAYNDSGQSQDVYARNAGREQPGTGRDSAITCENARGNPILITTGNKLEHEADIVSYGEEMPLVFERTYNHNNRAYSILGSQWYSNFDYQLHLEWGPYSTPDLATRRPDGRFIKFIPDGANKWIEDRPNAASYIVKGGDGYYTFYNAEEGTVERYGEGGNGWQRIVSLKNQRGVGWTFTYGGPEFVNPTQITHTSGRNIKFAYTATATTVTDPAGYVYKYNYITIPYHWGKVLDSVEYPDGMKITYHNQHVTDQPLELLGKSYNGVRYSTFNWASYPVIQYDPEGTPYQAEVRVPISTEHVGGVDKYSFSYTIDPNTGRVQSVLETNPLGKQATYKVVAGNVTEITGSPSPTCAGYYKEIVYDLNGNRDLVTDPNGGITDYDYDGSGRLSKKVEASGTAQARTTTYGWDAANNRLLSEAVAGLMRKEYTYTPEGLIASSKVTNLTGKGVPNQSRTTTVSYTGHTNGLLATKKVDGPLSGVADEVVYAYDTYGNLISETSALSGTLQHVVAYSNYNALGLPGRIAGANGAITDYTYDKRGRVLTEKRYVGSSSYTTTNVYDNRGRLSKTTAADGVATEFVYDGNNRLTKTRRAEPNSPYAALAVSLTDASSPVGISGGEVVPDSEMSPMACHPQPDCENEPPLPVMNAAAFASQTVPTTMTAGHVYSVTVRMTNTGVATWTAANNYRLGSINPVDNTTWGLGRVAVAGSVAPDQTATFTFNVTAPSTPGSYNFQWRMLREGVAWFGAQTPNIVVAVQAPPPTPVNNASYVSQVLPTSMESGKTYALSVQMKNNGTTTWTAANNYRLGLLSPTTPSAWGITSRVSLGGSVAPGATATFNVNVTAPSAGNYAFQWQMLQENVAWFGAKSPSTAVQVQVPPPPLGYQKFTYDNASNVTQIETGIEEMDGTLILMLSRSYIDYDELSRVRARRGNHSQNVRYEYDEGGNLKIVTDSAGKKTTMTYDALNRVITATDPKTGLTKFEYDIADRVTKITDPRNLATIYEVDGFGQLWKQTSPDSGITTFGYDAFGNRTQLKRADNVVTSYTHDSLGRLTSETAGTETHTFAYDVCAGGKGRLCQVVDPKGQLDYTYSPQGWLLTQKQRIGSSAIAFDQAFAYDGLGRLTGISYPGSVAVGYAYESGRLSAMTATIGGVVKTVASDLAYQPFGPLVGLTYGNGLTRGHNFDTDGRLTGISTMNASSVIQSLTFQYNVNDEITKITNGANAGLTQTYGYDELSRLTSVVATGANQAFEYDKTGNRASHTWGGLTDTYATAANSNRLLGVDGSRAKSFVHNTNGNITSVDDAVYNYDSFNRMSSAVKAGVTTSYWINALGQRTYKSQGAPKANGYMYGLDGQLAVEYDWNGPGWTHYLRLGSEPIAVVRGGQLYFLHNDHLGRPEGVTNSGKTVVWKASNFAFERAVTVDSIGGLNLGFPGQYYDAETTNWHNGFRDYSASIGRYLQTDPIGLQAGLNTFAYVENSPVLIVDPMGLEGVGPWTYAPGQRYGGTDCEHDAVMALMMDMTPLTSALQLGKDALGITVNFDGGGSPISLFDYGASNTGTAAGGYIAQGVANGAYDGHIDNMRRRAMDTSIRYDLRNAARNRAAKSMIRKAALVGAGKALGPAGAFYDFNKKMKACECGQK